MKHGYLDGRFGIAVALGALFAVACADPGTSPNAGKAAPNSASASFVNTGTADALHGEVDLCKGVTTGSSSQEFPFSWSLRGVVTQLDLSADDGCVQLFHDELVDHPDTTTITEGTLPAGWTLDSIRVELGLSCSVKTVESDVVPTALVVSGNDCGRRVIFWNHFTPPGGCTFTKGYYRNHPSATADAIADLGGTIAIGSTGETLTAAQAQAILNATPGQPGQITFTSNNLLNLAQQVITAILNGGGAVIQSDIDDANAGFTLASNKHALSSSLTADQIGDLIGPLDYFNNGNVSGFPHCTD